MKNIISTDNIEWDESGVVGGPIDVSVGCLRCLRDFPAERLQTARRLKPVSSRYMHNYQGQAFAR